MWTAGYSDAGGSGMVSDGWGGIFAKHPKLKPLAGVGAVIVGLYAIVGFFSNTDWLVNRAPKLAADLARIRNQTVALPVFALFVVVFVIAVVADRRKPSQ